MTLVRVHVFERFSAVWAVLLLSPCLVTAGCSASIDKAGGQRPAAPVVLTMLNPLNDIEPQPFVDAVDRISGGTLRIGMQSGWHGGQVGAEVDLVHAVQGGQAALGLAPASVWHGLGVRSFDALIAPFAVDSLALEEKVLASDLADTMLAGIDAFGLTGIGILPGPIRRPIGVTAQFLGPQDYRGRTLAISDSAVAARTFRALHAKTEFSAFHGQPIDGLDGIEHHLESVDGWEYDQPAHTITANVSLWPRPLVVFGNPRALAALDDSQRQILRKAAREAQLPTLEINREAESLGNLCRRGAITFLTANATQLEGLRIATEPVLAWLREDAATSWALDRIDSMRAEVTATGAADAPPSCDRSTKADQQGGAPISDNATPLDGVYTMNSTFDDVVAAGWAGDLAPENYGAWVLVVAGGRFADTQVNGPACTWGYGSWQVEGQTVHLLFSDGGGIAPNHSANRPGEAFAFRWSLYQDTLTLSPQPGQISPESLLAKPWHRISRTPQPELLSSRCPPPPEALPAD